MNELGLDIADVRYVLILQGHWDHYMGARTLQDEHTDALFGAAAEDWKMIVADQGDRAPRQDFVIEEGDTLTLGNTTLHFEITPGHTPSQKKSRSAFLESLFLAWDRPGSTHAAPDERDGPGAVSDLR